MPSSATSGDSGRLASMQPAPIGTQQQRLVVAGDAEVQQHAGDREHDHRLRRHVGDALQQQAERVAVDIASALLEADDRVAVADRLAGVDADLGDRAGARRLDVVVHLHRVEHRDQLAARDRVARP